MSRPSRIPKSTLAAALLLNINASLVATVSAATQTPGRLVEINHHQIYYETHGSGAPLVFLHGGGDSFHHSFSKVLSALSAHRMVIAIEQVGQGHSPDAPGKLSYAGMTEDTSALLRLLHIDAADVVGWSDGGIIALMLAARHPAQVRRVVASGANFAPDGLIPAVQEDVAHDSAAGEFDAAETADELRLNPGGEAQLLSVEAKLQQLWLTSPKPAELSPQILGTITQPVLVMAGDHDNIRIEHTLEMYHDLPNASLFIVPDCSHDVFNERPALAQHAILEFLNKP